MLSNLLISGQFELPASLDLHSGPWQPGKPATSVGAEVGFLFRLWKKEEEKPSGHQPAWRARGHQAAGCSAAGRARDKCPPLRGGDDAPRSGACGPRRREPLDGRRRVSWPRPKPSLQGADGEPGYATAGAACSDLGARYRHCCLQFMTLALTRISHTAECRCVGPLVFGRCIDF